jgi:hypothetical protein
MKTNSPLTTLKDVQYARMWPREIFDCEREFARELEVLDKSGVYVLYRDDIPYYIGQAAKLRRRLWQHANVAGSRYYNFWNFFSVFVPKEENRIGELEAILIAAMPTANSSQPRLLKEKFPPKANALLRRIRRNRIPQ